MNWKSVVWVSCLVPVLAGCGTTRNHMTDQSQYQAQRGLSRDVRGRAEVAWQRVCAENPRNFTDEFREGFFDGFLDYGTRGGTNPLPAVPPVSYSRYRKYLAPEGHCLVNDYYLGFQYGSDVAIADEKQQFQSAIPQTKWTRATQQPDRPAVMNTNVASEMLPNKYVEADEVQAPGRLPVPVPTLPLRPESVPAPVARPSTMPPVLELDIQPLPVPPAMNTDPPPHSSLPQVLQPLPVVPFTYVPTSPR